MSRPFLQCDIRAGGLCWKAVHGGVLISNTANGVELEVSLGINRTFPHSEIRKLEFIK